MWGYPKLDQVVREGKEPGIYEDRMTIMIDDGKVPQFAQQGCWLTCHDGQRDMPKQFTKEEVERNIQEAIEFHLEGLRQEGYQIPEPSTYSSYIDIAA